MEKDEDEDEEEAEEQAPPDDRRRPRFPALADATKASASAPPPSLASRALLPSEESQSGLMQTLAASP
jgi:hypothetical protein